MAAKLLRLICWNPELAAQRKRLLEARRFRVDAGQPHTSGLVGNIRDLAPDAVVIDLDRMPSHGRAVAAVLRQGKATRTVPIVFAGGAADKVARIRAELPDAAFAAWDGIAPAVRQAIAHPPAMPVKPPAMMQSYAGTPLIRKLGIKEGMAVAAIAAPDGFEDLLGDLPEGAALQPRLRPGAAMAIWFVHSLREAAGAVDAIAARIAALSGGAWIAVPKRSGKYRVDFTMNDVRTLCLEAGMVDYKICAVDADWTALKLAKRRKP